MQQEIFKVKLQKDLGLNAIFRRPQKTVDTNLHK